MPMHVDGSVLAFTAAVSLATGLAAGLAPALRLARSNVTDAIKEGGGRGGSDAVGRHASGARSSSWRSRCRSCCSSAPAC